MTILRTGLLDDKKRWIIVPCNDAMMDVPDPVDEFTKGNEQQPVQTETPISQDSNKQKKPGPDVSVDTPMLDANEHPPEGAPATSRDKPATGPEGKRNATSSAAGSHWGLMIIDTKSNVTRWLDGLVQLRYQVKDDKSVSKIASMFRAGTAAGKVLCGYGKLVGRERGGFTASTLKWLPHQLEDNQAGFDTGACGPHMYACLKHIYAHARALEDLHEHFRKSSRSSGNFKRGRRGFNSRVIRQEMQDMIHQEKERGEKASDLWLALNPEIMRILSLTITPQQLTNAIATFKKTEEGGSEGRRKSGGNDDDDNGDDDDDDDDDDEPEFKDIWDKYEAAKKDGTCDAQQIKSLQGFKEFLGMQQSLMNDAANQNESNEGGKTAGGKKAAKTIPGPRRKLSPSLAQCIPRTGWSNTLRL
jgi:hypothetical protein